MLEETIKPGEEFVILNDNKIDLKIVAFERQEYLNKIIEFEKKFTQFIDWKEKCFTEVHVEKDKIKRYKLKPIYGEVIENYNSFLVTEKQIWFLFKADKDKIIEKTNKVDDYLKKF